MRVYRKRGGVGSSAHPEKCLPSGLWVHLRRSVPTKGPCSFGREKGSAAASRVYRRRGSSAHSEKCVPSVYRQRRSVVTRAPSFGGKKGSISDVISPLIREYRIWRKGGIWLSEIGNWSQ